MANANASEIAATHREALVGIGWECGPVEAYGAEVGFEVTAGRVRRGRGYVAVPPHRRTFDAAGVMTVTRHGVR